MKTISRMINSFIKLIRVEHIEKRVRFVFATLILSLIMITGMLFSFDMVFIAAPIMIGAVYVLTYLSILEGIEKSEYLMLFIMPVLFTLCYYLFFYLFPVRWLTRVPFVGIYAISIYALLLTANIFNVGVEKSLRLYKAAYSVNYFYQTVIAFLAFNILFSLRSYFFVNALGSAVIIFPLCLQLLWTIRLRLTIDKEIILYAVFICIVLGELAFLISFMPLRASVAALLLTGSYYTASGLISALIDNRLFKNTIREYVFVFIFVFIVAAFTLTGW